MSLQPGQTLSRYRLTEQIGEGGMGVVWKATDTSLNREVAIKVLPEAFSQDPERLSRFEREARLLASLSHTSIAAIHGLEEDHGIRFLVMELVEGEGLDQRLAREPLSVERALGIGLEISEALESAHENGVIHRDLKPANVMLTPEGSVKLLDFGLAKAFEPASTLNSSSSLSRSPTMTSGGTQAGMILGTASYMSPEQARGKPVDRRADIWSFGCVLYECLAGSRTFGGETVSDSLAAILRGEPDLSTLPSTTPRRIRELLTRCLVKDAKNRLRDIGDARLELQQALTGQEWLDPGTSDSAPSTAPRPQRSFALAATGLILAGAVIGVAAWAGLVQGWFMTGPAPSALMLSIPVPDGLVPFFPRITPDGQTVVYIGGEKVGRDGEPATSRLYTRRLDENEAQPVQGSEGIRRFDLSPDGSRISFVAPTSRQSTRLQLWQMPLDRSAPPLAIQDYSDTWRGLLWVSRDQIVAVRETPAALVTIPVDGSKPGEPVPLDMGELDVNSGPVASLPNGKVLCSVSTWGDRGYQEDIILIEPDSGRVVPLVENAQYAKLLPNGDLMVSRHDTLLMIPFNADTSEITGGPVPVMGGLRAENTWVGAWFDLADDGTLVHLPGGLIGLERLLVYLEDNTEATPWSDEYRAYNSHTQVSRDGSHMAVVVSNAQQLYEIWISDLASPRLKRLVAEPGMDCYPRAWTQDAARLIYDCTGDNERQGIYARPVNGSSPPIQLMSGKEIPGQLNAAALSPDESVLLVSMEEARGVRIAMIPANADAAGDQTPLDLAELAGAGSLGFSPDGKWLAYVSDASGRNEAYLRRFHPGGSLGPENPVSNRGASRVTWSKTTTVEPFDLLITRPGVGKVYAVNMRSTPSLSLSRPREVLNPELLKPSMEHITDLPDGRWFGIQQGANEGDTNRISVVLNWLQDLEKRQAGR